MILQPSRKHNKCPCSLTRNPIEKPDSYQGKSVFSEILLLPVIPLIVSENYFS